MLTKAVSHFVLRMGRLLQFVLHACSVNSTTSDTKQQMTTLCAVNAGGDIVPPTHIFSGERYKRNPMEGCVHTLGGHQMVGYQQSYLMVD